jgi:Copper type II ascorbate-dependent monooxygenase, C-terminal domain
MRTSAFVMFWLLVMNVVGCGGGQGSGSTAGAVTYWQDVAPIYNDKCVRCHQAGGIAPFRLDDYASARQNATLELGRVTQGTMPPYFMVHDDSCGSFHDESTLTEQQKTTIAAWVNGGSQEGTPGALVLPDLPKLAGAVDIATPLFTPTAQGGALAQFDEYRCFLMDPPTTTDSFLTAYDVTPGQPSIIHHVIAFIVDPQRVGPDGRTNAAIMADLHAQSPDRAGWPCFGGAGDNVDASGLPVTWAPGQGIVNFPEGMGVPVHTTDKLVVQVHYNLADPGTAGLSDSTTVHLRFAPSVSRQLAFLLPDPFLESISNDTPDSLPAGKADATYTWTRSGKDIGIDGVPSVDLVAVMPHMHGRGLRQFLRLGPAGGPLSCAAHLENWSFHWQEFYFYKTPPVITPDTQVQVTCEYDTSADTTPVLPGWGTRNEMCLAVLMVALPAM